ncbi:hypothetical protein GW17_00044391 [Ensete ventricosum]|nr:hypothetical protein GW17_00044391 [Ensete ventricosum]
MPSVVVDISLDTDVGGRESSSITGHLGCFSSDHRAKAFQLSSCANGTLAYGQEWSTQSGWTRTPTADLKSLFCSLSKKTTTLRDHITPLATSCAFGSMEKATKAAFLLLSLFFLLLPQLRASGDCDCTTKREAQDTAKALTLKLIAIAAILSAGAMGVLIPILGRSFAAMSPESDVFFVIKAFAAGVILATGLIHILPDAFESLTSPCLGEQQWQDFPVAGFIAMSSAMVTLMIDSFATSYYERSHFSKARPVEEKDERKGDEESASDHAGHVHVHTHATHGHAHGSAAAAAAEEEEASLSDKIRHRVISQKKYSIYFRSRDDEKSGKCVGSGAGYSGPFRDHWDFTGCIRNILHHQASGCSLELPSIL